MNTINQKFYIGIHGTNTDPRKFHDGYLGSGTVINQAIQKYGKENFDHEVLEVFSNQEDAYIVECQYLESCLGDSQCYNIAEGGNRGLPWDKSFEIFKKRNPDGYRKYLDTRSEVQKKAWSDQNLKDKQSAVQKEIWANAENHEKASSILKEVYQNPEVRNHCSIAQKKAWANQERRQQASETQKEVWSNPELLEKHSQAVKEGLRAAPMSQKAIKYNLRRTKNRLEKLMKQKKISSSQVSEARSRINYYETELNVPLSQFVYEEPS